MLIPWLQIRVELVDGGPEGAADPGRVLLVGPSHTFAHLAEAIDVAFARWDRGHLSEFVLTDGRRIGWPDEEEPDVLDIASLEVAAHVVAGAEITYLFDFGAGWEHRCRVLDEPGDLLDHLAEGDRPPKGPLVIDGWGWIPDQHGRESADPDG